MWRRSVGVSSCVQNFMSFHLCLINHLSVWLSCSRCTVSDLIQAGCFLGGGGNLNVASDCVYTKSTDSENDYSMCEKDLRPHQSFKRYILFSYIRKHLNDRKNCSLVLFSKQSANNKIMPSQPPFGQEWYTVSNPYFMMVRVGLCYGFPNLNLTTLSFKLEAGVFELIYFFLNLKILTSGFEKRQFGADGRKTERKICVVVFNRLSVNVSSAEGGQSRKPHLHWCSKSSGQAALSATT